MTWPARPSLVQADLLIEAPGLTVYQSVHAGDLDGDGRPDLVLRGLEAVDIYLGRASWPARIAADAADIRVLPSTSLVDVADVTGDGRADLVATLIGEGADAAVLEGRPDFAPAYDLAVDAEARVGTGTQQHALRIAPDLDGDGLAELTLADHAAGRVYVYPGGPDLAARLARPEAAAWSVAGVTDTFEVPAFDLTGDGLAELILDRTAVFFGGIPRDGPRALAAMDGRWVGLPEGALWSGDVDGDGDDDVLANAPSADASTGASAGRIAVLLGPLAAAVAPTPALPTETPSPGPTPPGTAAPPDPTAPSTATPPAPGDAAGRVYLPALLDRAAPIEPAPAADRDAPRGARR